jgi:hypothetical protein
VARTRRIGSAHFQKEFEQGRVQFTQVLAFGHGLALAALALPSISSSKRMACSGALCWPGWARVNCEVDVATIRAGHFVIPSSQDPNRQSQTSTNNVSSKAPGLHPQAKYQSRQVMTST